MYWPEDDKPAVETPSHVIYINKKTINICVDGSSILNQKYKNLHIIIVRSQIIIGTIDNDDDDDDDDSNNTNEYNNVKVQNFYHGKQHLRK